MFKEHCIDDVLEQSRKTFRSITLLKFYFTEGTLFGTGKIIHSQIVTGAVDESNLGLSFNLKRKMIVDSYKKIINEINENSI